MPTKKSEIKSPPANAKPTRKRTAVKAGAKAEAKPEAKPRASKPRAPKMAKPKPHYSGDSLLRLSEAINGDGTSQVGPEQVAERAYFRWLERGCPMGSPDQDWFEAEMDLGVEG